MSDSGNTYLDAGVDLEAANRSVEAYGSIVDSTRVPGVIGSIGGFGGMFSLKDAGLLGDDPILVTATDGVGTKLRLAHAMNKHDTIGQDLVAMCVNDVVTTGAKPVLFLDYLATGKLDVDQAAQIVAGIAQACKACGCALVGGETAEMPGFYDVNEYDVAGFCVGVVERSNVLQPDTVSAGDLLVGLAASGFHSNGYSLIRHIIDTESLALDTPLPGDDVPLGVRLLEPTRLYVHQVLEATELFGVKAAAHITGGGVIENVPRALPKHLAPRFDTWHTPDWMTAFCDIGRVDREERLRVFNMGIGMVLVVSPEQAESVVAHFDGAQIVGAVV